MPAIYYQLPVCCAGAAVERPDLYVVCLDETGYPCTPVLLCDAKLDNLSAAVWERTGYVVRAMEVRHDGVNNLPLQLGLALSGMTMILHVFLALFKG